MARLGGVPRLWTIGIAVLLAFPRPWPAAAQAPGKAEHPRLNHREVKRILESNLPDEEKGRRILVLAGIPELRAVLSESELRALGPSGAGASSALKTVSRRGNAPRTTLSRPASAAASMSRPFDAREAARQILDEEGGPIESDLDEAGPSSPGHRNGEAQRVSSGGGGSDGGSSGSAYHPPSAQARGAPAASGAAQAGTSASGMRAIVRPFLTGYVGLPYLAVPNTDESFGFDRGGVPFYIAVPGLTSPNLPKGLFVTDDFPDDGGALWAMVRGVPAQAGDFFPTVHFVLGHEDLYDGPVELKVLPTPKYTVLNPFEREPWMSAGFGAGEPALLRARFREPGDKPVSGQLRTLSGVTSKKVYFEAYVEAVGDDFFAGVGVEASPYPEPRGRIGDLDSWGYCFRGGISIPSGSSAKSNAFRTIPWEQYKRLAHPTKAVAGDTIMVALDPKAGNLWFGKNGRWFEGGDPATGLIPTVFGLAIGKNSFHGDFRGAVGGASGTRVTLNFGDQKWKYPAPAGFGGIPR